MSTESKNFHQYTFICFHNFIDLVFANKRTYWLSLHFSKEHTYWLSLLFFNKRTYWLSLLFLISVIIDLVYFFLITVLIVYFLYNIYCRTQDPISNLYACITYLMQTVIFLKHQLCQEEIQKHNNAISNAVLILYSFVFFPLLWRPHIKKYL